jgi:hypothetical protein
VKSITYALEDMEYLSMGKIIQIREKAEETKNTTLAFIRYLKNKDKDKRTRTHSTLTP